MPIIPKNLHTNYGLNTTEDKGVTSKMYLTQIHSLDSLTHWSVGPRRPSNESDAVVAGWLYM